MVAAMVKKKNGEEAKQVGLERTPRFHHLKSSPMAWMVKCGKAATEKKWDGAYTWKDITKWVYMYISYLCPGL